MDSSKSAIGESSASSIPPAELDVALTAQLIIAWAGEGGEEPRLAWWRTDLVSEFGGQDLFQRLLPTTWMWATYQAAREAARRHDATLRAQDSDPDRIVSLFHFGFEIDELLEERLLDLKRSGTPPEEALPALGDVTVLSWTLERFLEWVRGHGTTVSKTAPIGRRIGGEPPQSLGDIVRCLVAALDPLRDQYPLPHFRRSK